MFLLVIPLTQFNGLHSFAAKELYSEEREEEEKEEGLNERLHPKELALVLG